MKKILITILSIFGICFSFCSSDTYEVNFHSGVSYYDTIGGNLISTASYTTVKGRLGMNDSQLGYYNFTGFNGDVFVDSICLDIYYYNSSRTYTFMGVPATSTCPNSSSCLCFDLTSLNINLKDSGYVFGPVAYYDPGYNPHNGICRVALIPTGDYPYYFRVGDSDLYFSLGGYLAEKNAWGQNILPYSITLTIPTTPKFKVNYGNTSYEYELTEDLSIYLKSPVVQNGNTFTYAGKTGLNLFYNGTSQRYDKDKLYLKSMYWYDKNIFTPICL